MTIQITIQETFLTIKEHHKEGKYMTRNPLNPNSGAKGGLILGSIALMSLVCNFHWIAVALLFYGCLAFAVTTIPVYRRLK